jgi:diacylglycerol kinase
VAWEILSSTEYRSDLISSYYVAYIQRAPDPGGLATFLAGLASGAGDEAVQAGILGSTEFAIDRSGAASGAYETSVFLFELYALLLNRGIDPNGDGTFGSQLAAGVSATQVATEILNSKEYRIDLITGYYEKYLGRGTDPGGLATYLAAFSAGATNESVEAGILGSPEFFAKSG